MADEARGGLAALLRMQPGVKLPWRSPAAKSRFTVPVHSVD
jgi:hypothetical protein